MSFELKLILASVAIFFLFFKDLTITYLKRRLTKADDDKVLLPVEKSHDELMDKLKADEEAFLKAEKDYDDSKKDPNN